MSARPNARLVAAATFAGWLVLSASACGSAPSSVRVDDPKTAGPEGVDGGVHPPEERDASVDAASTARCRSEDDRYAFVTRDTLVGTFAKGEGGAAAWRLADEFCQQQATKEHRCLQGRKWHAWLSGEGIGSADDHVLLSLYTGGIVRQTEDRPVTIAREARSLVFGYQREETEVFDPAVTVAWTGTLYDTTASVSCSNWTGGDDVYRSPGAVVGDPSSAVRSTWTETGAYRPCSEAHPIYCFEAR